VRKEGAPSQERRPATMGKMRQVHANFRENRWYGPIVKYGCPAFVNFQVHYIRRIDCTSQFMKENFQVHDLFPDLAGNVCLNWAKNVHEERDAPWQIMLGSMDPTFCVLLSLAIWLEFFHGESPEVAVANPYVFAFKSDDFCIPEGGNKTHNFVMDLLTKLFRGQGAGCTFKAEIMGLLGSHTAFASSVQPMSKIVVPPRTKKTDVVAGCSVKCQTPMMTRCFAIQTPRLQRCCCALVVLAVIALKKVAALTMTLFFSTSHQTFTGHSELLLPNYLVVHSFGSLFPTRKTGFHP
jgi:hypothetical protein